jgi:hypothetical protein
MYKNICSAIYDAVQIHGTISCAERLAQRSSREERQASGPWHHPSGSGRPAGRYCNRTCRGWALARPKVVPRSRKRACRLPEGSPRRAHRVGPIGAKRCHALTWNLLHLHIAFTGFASGAAPPKTVYRGHTGRVEDRKASGPWQHPSGSCRLSGQRIYSNSTCWSGGLARTKEVP